MPKTATNLSSPQTICIVRLSALGDCYLLVPLLNALHQIFPNATIHWVIDKRFAPLFESLEHVQLLPIDKTQNRSDYKQLKSFFADFQFDLLIAAQASMRVNLLYRYIKAERKIGFDKARARDLQWMVIKERIPAKEEHLLDGFLGFAKYLSPEHAEDTAKAIHWPLCLDSASEDWALSFIKPSSDTYCLAINPGASKLERTPSASFYISLLTRLFSLYNCKIILTGAPTAMEIELSEQIMAAFPRKRNLYNLTGKTDLKQLAAILAKVDLLIAPDTGPVHIATAFSTPVVGLYAVAPSQLSGPYFSRDFVVDKYPQAVEKFLGKSADSVKWGTRVHKREAMALIKPKEVMKKVQAIIDSLSTSKR